MSNSMPGAGDRVGDFTISCGLGCGSSGPVYEAVGADGREVALKLSHDPATIAHHASLALAPTMAGEADGWLFLALNPSDPAAATLAEDPGGTAADQLGADVVGGAAGGAAAAAVASLFIDEVPLATVRRDALSTSPSDTTNDTSSGDISTSEAVAVVAALATSPAAVPASEEHGTRRKWPVVLGAAAAALTLIGGLVWGLGMRSDDGTVMADVPRQSSGAKASANASSSPKATGSSSATASSSPTASDAGSSSASPTETEATQATQPGQPAPANPATTNRPGNTAPAAPAAPVAPAAPNQQTTAPVKPVTPTTTAPPAPVPDNCPGGDFTGNRFDGQCGTPPQDNCPNGDFSPSRTDGQCGTPPPPPGTVRVFRAEPGPYGQPGCTGPCFWVGLEIRNFPGGVTCDFTDRLGQWHRQGFPGNWIGRTQAWYAMPGGQITVYCNGVPGSMVW